MIKPTIRDRMAQAVQDGDQEGVVAAVKDALEEGELPLTLISEVLNPAIKGVGEKFAAGEIYLPELIMAAEAMEAAMEVLQPVLEQRAEHIKKLGRVVIATVQGDIHDIGKNIVASLLRTHGFEVLDLGKNVPAAEIVASAESFQADVIGLSALLSTTLPYCNDTIRLLEELGVREKYHVFIGGGAATPEYAASIGAEYGGPHAEAGVAKIVKALHNEVLP